MDKTILLSVLKSKKIMVLKHVAGASDLQKLHTAFADLLRTDEKLASCVGNTDIVIFQSHNDQFNTDVDVENGTVIPNNSVVSAFLVQNVMVDTPHENVMMDTLHENVMVDTPDENVDQNGHSASNSAGDTQVETTSVVQNPNVKDPSKTVKPKPASKKVPVRRSHNTPDLSYPSKMPMFSIIVTTAQAENRIMDEYLRLVRECGVFITACTRNPSKKDYDDFCRTIGDHFTSVRDRDGSMTSFKMQVTKCVRNLRYRTQKSTLLRKEGHTSKRPYNKAFQLAVDAAENTITSTSSALESMQKHKQEMFQLVNANKACDRKHISRLMKETYAVRREAVTLAKKCVEVTDEYPALLHQQWFIEEYNRVVQVSTADRQARYDTMIHRLQVLSKVHKPSEEINAKNQINLLFEASKSIGCPKDVHPVQICSINDNFVGTCDLHASAFVKLYFTEDGSVGEAVLLAEGQVLFVLHEKSVFYALDALLGAYYVFNATYPAGYSSFLKLLQENVLGIRLSKADLVGAAKLSNFNKRLNNAV